MENPYAAPMTDVREAEHVFLVLMSTTKLRLNNSLIGNIQDRSRQQASAAPSK
jgi:hypothetical protein